jgi:nitrogen fixation protein FixH
MIYKEKNKKEEAEKLFTIQILVAIGFVLFFGVFVQNIAADQIVHKFKSPSFSGIGTSSHYLTIENQEFNRKMSIKEEIKALQEQIERDKENTTLARFIRNLESRIYAQLSRQLVENLFGDTASTSGTIELEGNIITYTSDGQFITLKITDPDGNITEITLPIGSFTF